MDRNPLTIKDVLLKKEKVFFYIYILITKT